jgi:hypothetical protein
MSSINPSSPKPINPFAAVVRKPVNLAQQLGFLESDSPEATELAPIPAAANEAGKPEVASAAPANVDTFVTATGTPSLSKTPSPAPSTPFVVPASAYINSAVTAQQTRAFAASSFHTDLEAANNIPAPMLPLQTQDAGAQGALIGAYQAPIARGFGSSAKKSWNPRTWSKKQKIWTGVGIAVVLIIIIGAAAGSAAKHGGGGGGGGGGNGDGGTSGNCDASDPDSICYCDGDSC